ncbi:MAG: putative Ig domain-containing protein, partial [Verrucomicrobia bacterium]|nr:putative Ig domain-containing protein [Verrucomicrobiota bacterium]
NQTFTLTVAPTLPVITSAVSATGSVGSAFSYTIAASNFARTYAATGLPSGLSVNATSGVISGVPATAGNATVVLSASNGAGNITKSLALTIKPLPPVISSAASASAKVGVSFTYQIAASSSPTAYSATGLPGGLTVNATKGLIAGTPTAIDGTYNVTLGATNAGGTGNKVLALTIAPTLPVITSAVSATGSVGSTFSYTIAASNFARTYAATGLPSGLSVNATSGVIRGVPATAGNTTVVVSASNGAGNTTKTLALTIKPLPPVINSAVSASALVGVPFSYQITASNSPTTYGATGLPSGLTINATNGIFSGTPSTAGNSTVTLTASNAGGSATKSLALKVTIPPLVITSTVIPSGVLNKTYVGHTFTATGGSGGNVWSLSDGFLPPGMTLNASTAQLAGTPKNAGSFAFVLQVKDSKGALDDVDVVLEVKNANANFTVGDVLSVIPRGGATQSPGNVTCSFAYSPSGSTWNEGVSEEKVFYASMNSSSGWRLGIGKGGQVYSLRGAFGEAVPPQRADAPWVDEAWQFVATNTDLVNPIQQFQKIGQNRPLGFPIMFFIHQSGIYRGGLAGNSLVGSATEPFYSPMLKNRWDPATRTLSVVSWSQMARSPNVWKSGMLTYASYRDLGDGSIEVTNFVTNFGDQDLTFINTPWGGARHSSFPETILSTTTGGWSKGSSAAYGTPSPIKLNQTGGWQAWVRNSTQESANALAIVFGKDPVKDLLPIMQTGQSLLTYGAGGDSVRDYDVCSIQNKIQLQAGQSIACRWHLVVGQFGQTRIKASNLSSYAGLWIPETDASVVTPVWTTGGTPASSGTGSPNLYLYAQPIPGTVPVFVMEDTRTGRKFATTDPYELCPTAPYPNPLPTTHPQYALYQNRVVHYQYSSPGAVRELLGYASREARATGGDVKVSLPSVGSTPLNLWVPAQ